MKKQKTIYIEDKIIEEVKKIAAENDRSDSYIIVDAIKEYIEKRKDS